MPEPESIAVPAHERKRRVPAKSKDQSYGHLPIRQSHTIIPEAVKADPQAYEQIGEERTYELGITAPEFFMYD